MTARHAIASEMGLPIAQFENVFLHYRVPAISYNRLHAMLIPSTVVSLVSVVFQRPDLV